jgi:glyoxylase-like metal-dependent hydrolase (beta-lactamase superfamily II)
MNQNGIKLGKTNNYIVSAGSWKGDGGASMGVLPKAIWQKKITPDEKNRIPLALNLLIIRTAAKTILIDTGIGNKITAKQQKIYQPSEFCLPENLKKLGIEPEEIDYVVLTHLHFDHAGGIVSAQNGEYKLTFPNATHIIQQREWEIAKHPDGLNMASYNFKADLTLLEESGNFLLIDGDHQLTDEVRLELVGGHTEGMQSIRIESDGELAYYAGDIITSEPHLHPAVTSAYDVCRKDTYHAKKRILSELQQREGILFFPHDHKKAFIQL